MKRNSMDTVYRINRHFALNVLNYNHERYKVFIFKISQWLHVRESTTIFNIFLHNNKYS